MRQFMAVCTQHKLDGIDGGSCNTYRVDTVVDVHECCYYGVGIQRIDLIDTKIVSSCERRDYD